ncbi:type 4a pilus biogenesis protein PilO [uncultured Bifidobacterium sp.]|uniref:type 4a pilus biogenesis protein PilO n=1 Tax=uncultured Bifidobacterium sp. TaxID=165187 RepID=UPI002603F414|nr:type 4a pilus biogenesis protein PilO [uncultured Bifidobacterium sp.]
MTMNKHRLIWIGLTAGIVLVLVVLWLVGVSPRLSQIKAADQETARIEAQNKTTQNEIEDLSIASANITLQKNRLSQLQRQIPSSFGQKEFISSLNAAADKATVTIQSVSFSDGVAGSLPSEVGTVTSGQLVEVPVTITAQGAYSKLNSFVKNVQGIERIALATDVSYSISADDDSQSTLTMNCTIWSLISSSSSSNSTESSTTQ